MYIKKLTLLLLFISSGLVSQSNTDIYLFDLKKTNTGYQLSNKKKISANEGYDNQPFFYDHNTLLFASSRNNQTDILRYQINKHKFHFINFTPNGGEYSPQRIPNSKDISAVRLDTSGLQRFYRYAINSGKSKEIIKDLKVAYPLWLDENIIFSAVIGENSLELFKSDLIKKTNISLYKNIGRSLHKIPNTTKISFINKNKTQWEILSLDARTLKIDTIAALDGNYEDIAWLSKDIILQAKGNKILQLQIKTDIAWKIFYMTDSLQIKNISRITISPDTSKIAIVGESF